MKKFFEKKAMDLKFRGSGQGHRLDEEKPKPRPLPNPGMLYVRRPTCTYVALRSVGSGKKGLVCTAGLNSVNSRLFTSVYTMYMYTCIMSCGQLYVSLTYIIVPSYGTRHFVDVVPGRGSSCALQIRGRREGGEGGRKAEEGRG